MVRRYSINECASTGVEHDGDGDYVLYDDYEDLLDRHRDLQGKYEGLVEVLGELWGRVD